MIFLKWSLRILSFTVVAYLIACGGGENGADNTYPPDIATTDRGQNKEDAGPNARAQEPAKAIRIGVQIKRSRDLCLKKWTPTAEYLTQNIPGYSFSIVPFEAANLKAVAKRCDIDFVLTNPSIYVELEVTVTARRIATFVNKAVTLGKSTDLFSGVVLTSADNHDIADFNDIMGKSFIAPFKKAFAGWVAVRCEFKKHGLNIPDGFAEMRFGGSMNSDVYALRDVRADAGSVRSDTLERMAREGKIRMEDFTR